MEETNGKYGESSGKTSKSGSVRGGMARRKGGEDERRRDRGGVSSAIERRRMSRIIERETHYPVIRPVASGAIGNSLLCLVGAVFNG